MGVDQHEKKKRDWDPTKPPTDPYGERKYIAWLANNILVIAC